MIRIGIIRLQSCRGMMNSRRRSAMFAADCRQGIFMKLSFSTTLGALSMVLALELSSHAAVTGWLDWRGPNQNGTSLEKGLPTKIDGKQSLWTADFPGQSTPVIA